MRTHSPLTNNTSKHTHVRSWTERLVRIRTWTEPINHGEPRDTSLSTSLLYRSLSSYINRCQTWLWISIFCLCRYKRDRSGSVVAELRQGHAGAGEDNLSILDKLCVTLQVEIMNCVFLVSFSVCVHVCADGGSNSLYDGISDIKRAKYVQKISSFWTCMD